MKKCLFTILAAMSTQMLFGATTLTPGQKAADQQMEQKSEENLSISEVYEGGRKIKMSDGSIYDVDKNDSDVSGGWLGGDVRIECQGNGQYPCKIHNKWTGSTVKAKKYVPEQEKSNSGD